MKARKALKETAHRNPAFQPRQTHSRTLMHAETKGKMAIALASEVKLIGALEEARPEVFVDSVQMAPQGGQVALKVKGRAFCWNSAPR